MSKSNYIPISKYLQTSDVNDEEIPPQDRFYFYIGQKDSFFVYKSLACFLSPKAAKCLSIGQNKFTIDFKDIQYNLITIQNSLIGLLRGKSLIINKFNFVLFQKVFEFLGNYDFQLFFGDKSPSSVQSFYLSINSLKNIPDTILENKLSCSYDSSFLSIPIGLVHLFWKSQYSFPTNHILPQFSKNQILNYFRVLKDIIYGYSCRINSEQKDFFQIISIHQNILNDLCEPITSSPSYNPPQIQSQFQNSKVSSPSTEISKSPKNSSR